MVFLYHKFINPLGAISGHLRPISSFLQSPISAIYWAVPWCTKTCYLHELKYRLLAHERMLLKSSKSTWTPVPGHWMSFAPVLFTEITSRVASDFALSRNLSFRQGAGGPRKPHDSPWDLPCRDHCHRGVSASVPPHCSAGAAAMSGSSSPFQEQTPSARKHDCSARSMSKLTFCWVCLILDKQLASEPELKIAFNM